MANSKHRKPIPSQKPNVVSHAAHCSVCAHPQREEIEAQYVSWGSPTKITADFNLGNRSAVYRHATAFGLTLKRAKNIRAALERIIERVDDVKVTGGAIVQAVDLLARINSRGELVKADEQVGMHDLYSTMSLDELETYAKDGLLPIRFGPLADTKISGNSGGDENA